MEKCVKIDLASFCTPNFSAKMQALARILHLCEGGGKLVCARNGNGQHLHEWLEVFQSWMGNELIYLCLKLYIRA